MLFRVFPPLAENAFGTTYLLSYLFAVGTRLSIYLQVQLRCTLFAEVYLLLVLYKRLDRCLAVNQGRITFAIYASLRIWGYKL